MAPSTRRALRRQGSGRVQFVTEPIPACGTSDALIRVHAVSLNYKDAGVALGKFPWPGVEKGIVGSEFAGQILSVGENVKTFKTGDRVVSLINQYAITGNETNMDAQMGFSIDGTLAEYIVVPENVLVKIPDSLSWAEASMIPCSGVTAWNALRMPTFNIAGKTVLIQGTGGTALVCLALAVKAGARVIVTSSSDEKLQRVKSLGAWGSVNYATNPDWETEVLKLTDGVGVDIVIEHGGAETLLKSVTSVKKGGQISQVGFLTSTGGGDFAALVGMIIYKVVRIVGIQTGIKVDLENFMEFIRSTQLSFESCIDRVYDFEQAAEALEYSRSSKLFGKVIVKVA